MPEPRSYRKPLLYALIGSVIVGAVLGIFLVLRDQWGWFEVRVMLTTVIIAIASLGGLACDLSKLPRGHNLLPRAGLLLTLVAAGSALLGMWSDIDSEAFWKTVVVLAIHAVATVHVCLLSIARLVGRFRWVSFITNQLIYGLAIMLAIMIVGEIDSEATWRFIAALSIIVAAMTLVIPILYRIGRLDGRRETLMPTEERNLVSIDEEITRLQQRIAQLESLRSKLAGESDLKQPINTS